jgi:hypothetical protein
VIAVRRASLAGALLGAAAAQGCAIAPCTPSTIVVRDAAETSVVESRLDSVSFDPLGHRMDHRRDVVVPRFWVRDADGHWIAVDEATWRRAAKGQPLDVCR